VIPARGGSKRIPGKNIKPLCGKPLLAYAIDAAKGAGLFDRIIVSTDSAEIAEVAKNCGAEVPFLRPSKLAKDGTATTPVIQHAVRFLERNGETADVIVLLEPTTPLRTAQDVKNCVEMLFAKKADSVVSVRKVPHPPHWMLLVDKDRKAKEFIKNGLKIKTRTGIPELFELNAAVYVVRKSVLMKRGTIFGSRLYAYEMPAERSVDIDEPIDFKLAEALLGQK
jgi:N-acylneuraminate cytidylyltransferase/CMP-N,N'-diacetyllegionaminic acid synthase